ncbi:hypothetical protein C8R43DRAFT_576053 [Mycena crocata]|nr:hypothetical protein C8R43DRAFT_576053 [Mycena crocata]
MFAVLRLMTLAAVATRFVAAAPTLVTVTAPNFGGEPEATTVPAVIIGVDSAKSQTTYAVNQDETDGSSTIAFVTGTANVATTSNFVEPKRFLRYRSAQPRLLLLWRVARERGRNPRSRSRLHDKQRKGPLRDHWFRLAGGHGDC